MRVQVVPVLEIGGTHVTAALVRRSDWSLEHRGRLDVNAAANADSILAQFAQAAESLGADSGVAWGIAMPDPFDYVAGVALFDGVGKYEALFGIDVGAALRERLRAGSLRFVNDADAFVIGEWCGGSAVGAHRAVGITLGTGLGTGWIVDGQVTTSEPGVPPLGRARTIELNGIGLEEIVSTRGIRRRWIEAGGHPELDVREIAALARGGDERATDVLARTFVDLGRGLRPALQAFRPDVVVIGGSMSASWQLVVDDYLRGLDWPDAPPHRVAADTEAAGLRGAAYVATS